MSTITTHPHGAEALLHAGAPLAEAKAAIILLHGRGASAEDILGLANPLHLPDVAYLAPQASGHRWYPESFLAERERNEPWLSSALQRVEEIVDSLQRAGIPSEKIVIGGFSQGACLATEFVASHPRRYAALLTFTGGLIGPLGSDLHHGGDLAGMPVLLTNGDRDPHIPWRRTEESAAQLREMGAEVTVREYPGRPHTITQDEIDEARKFLEKELR